MSIDIFIERIAHYCTKYKHNQYLREPKPSAGVPEPEISKNIAKKGLSQRESRSSLRRSKPPGRSHFV